MVSTLGSTPAEEDEPFDPVDIGLFGSVAVVPGADRLSDLVKQLGFSALPHHQFPNNGRAAARLGAMSKRRYRGGLKNLGEGPVRR